MHSELEQATKQLAIEAQQEVAQPGAHQDEIEVYPRLQLRYDGTDTSLPNTLPSGDGLRDTVLTSQHSTCLIKQWWDAQVGFTLRC